MLRLMKYEIRKNITGLVILFGIIIGLEGYFLVSAIAESRKHTSLSAAFLVIASVVAFFAVFMFGVSSYSKELKSKTSYMTFMAPLSSFSIIGSKLISTLLAGTFFAVLLAIFAFADMALFEKVLPETELFTEFIEVIAGNAGYSIAEVGLAILVTIIEMLISFFAIVAMAYLAITLSSTLFQNKKYKGVISVVIFFAINWIINKIGEFLPEIYDDVTNITEAIVATFPAWIYYGVVMVLSLIVSAKLLDKKVSL